MRRGLTLQLAAALWLMSAVPSQAAYFTVNTTTDVTDMVNGDGVCASFNGLCGLRAAIEETNALPGSDGITVPAGTYAVPPLQITDALVIGGAGAEETIVSSGGGTAFTTTGADLALLDMTISGGQGGNVGGGVANYGRLTVIKCVIRNNTAQNVGGGIYNNEGSVLTVIGSTIHNNFAWNVGGGISNDGSADIVNSTISANQVLNVGGGIYNGGSLRCTNCTLTLNGAINTPGSGLDSGTDSPTRLTLENTILANNRQLTLNQNLQLIDTGPAADCDSGGQFTSGEYNLVQLPNWCGLNSNNLFNLDALLGPLQDNGGSTPTHALQTGSPAIDAANPATPGTGGGACPIVDQRGIARPYGVACDIGAFEATPCGNGQSDPGESCDDGNGIDGDGCDSNCTATACGNGVTTSGEECDDGNLADGDCCSSSCELTIDDDLISPSAGGSSVYVRESGSGLLKWKWQGGSAMTADDFGDPTTSTTYTLCLVDESGASPSLVMTAQAAAGEMCGGTPCWRRTGSGFLYKGNIDGPGRMGKVKLKAAANGGSIFVKGKGRRLRLGRLPFLLPLRVVLRKSDETGTFGAAFGGPKSNALDRFKATSD